MRGAYNMIEYASITSKGSREVNEDRIGITVLDDNTICFAVADGLGGHGRGDLAAELAIKTADDVFRAFYNRKDILKLIFESAQKRVLFERKELGERFSLKTTLSAAVFRGNKFSFGTIGDSRILVFRNGSLAERSHDHSLAQLLCDAGDILPEEVRTHPDRNRLLRCIGDEWGQNSYELSESETVCDVNTAVLICTDGFWSLISEADITGYLKESGSAREWLSKMETVVSSAAEAIQSDNYSAITVMIK